MLDDGVYHLFTAFEVGLADDLVVFQLCHRFVDRLPGCRADVFAEMQCEESIGDREQRKNERRDDPRS